ncbi:MAG: hypothetical protein HW391_1057 [Chloroflexi bacterium]|nr:hypothetical protein [Chloroflexota bacterium]
MDTGERSRIGELNTTLASILAQREILAKLPTWPWSAGTLRGFVTAILLPMTIFLVQRGVSLLLG